MGKEDFDPIKGRGGGFRYNITSVLHNTHGQKN